MAKFYDATNSITTPVSDSLYYETGGNAIGKIKGSLRKSAFVFMMSVGTSFAVPQSASAYAYIDAVSPVAETIFDSRIKPVEENLASTSSINKDIIANVLLMEIEELGRLSDNWDGYGASAPIPTILDNAERFVKNLITQGLQLPNEDSMYATPYGTIVIDIQNERGIVSIEIGNEKLGFFTDYHSGENYGSEGITTDFEHIPEEIAMHLS